MGLTTVEKYIPGTRWLRGYTLQYAVADLIAGITVGLTVLPQGLAYAALAGLEPQVSVSVEGQRLSDWIEKRVQVEGPRSLYSNYL